MPYFWDAVAVLAYFALVIGVGLVRSRCLGRIVRGVGSHDRAGQSLLIGGGFRRLGRLGTAPAKTNQRRQERELAHGMTLRDKCLKTDGSD